MKTLADFLGVWTILRQISHADGTEGAFEGRAVWTPTEGGAEYLETGYLVLPQGRFAAERRYSWDAELRVFFDDGRFFHRVPGEGGAASHWCDPDQYDALYDFSLWPDWRAEWRVRGPRKDYVMVSRYARATG